MIKIRKRKIIKEGVEERSQRGSRRKESKREVEERRQGKVFQKRLKERIEEDANHRNVSYRRV
jgi:hypothetical protein